MALGLEAKEADHCLLLEVVGRVDLLKVVMEELVM